jgi:hypothetical protein
MRGHPHTAMQDLDVAGGGPRFDLLVHERLRYAVEVIIDGDVIVDIDARFVVTGELVPADGQGFQGRPIEPRVGSFPRSRQTLERSGI